MNINTWGTRKSRVSGAWARAKWAGNQTGTTAQKKRLARREQAADVALSVETPLREMWRAARSARRADALAAELHLPEAAATRTHVPLAAALLDLYAAFEDSSYRFQDLLVALVASDLFLQVGEPK